MPENPKTLDEEVERFISKLDRLAKEKPVGFFGYLATCGSAIKLSDFTEITEGEEPQRRRERRKP